ncbi:C2H2-type zinc finger-containing protein [Heterostelium album PN500]|uniref:C2H2-type zinc finger-containing protein n=1 Tax=Heterostelium pallidum (strain ATCC 26659 / Pp 5 / PN500) TaxID=670386 RepID=D3BNV8_HETP5|nr:C2H2-type zinc finger-containing protein [Heterostelium album PN500]EFA76877.1 C2H2-type zinc finger-containing protein [Heterostelium album PN500]|eukprot:XP_020429009.1 C2H2-type zinc finger-containing protein [Heterostelium album PN500]
MSNIQSSNGKPTSVSFVNNNNNNISNNRVSPQPHQPLSPQQLNQHQIQMLKHQQQQLQHQQLQQQHQQLQHQQHQQQHHHQQQQQHLQHQQSTTTYPASNTTSYPQTPNNKTYEQQQQQQQQQHRNHSAIQQINQRMKMDSAPGSKASDPIFINNNNNNINSINNNLKIQFPPGSPNNKQLNNSISNSNQHKQSPSIPSIQAISSNHHIINLNNNNHNHNNNNNNHENGHLNNSNNNSSNSNNNNNNNLNKSDNSHNKQRHNPYLSYSDVIKNRTPPNETEKVIPPVSFVPKISIFDIIKSISKTDEDLVSDLNNNNSNFSSHRNPLANTSSSITNTTTTTATTNPLSHSYNGHSSNSLLYNSLDISRSFANLRSTNKNNTNSNNNTQNLTMEHFKHFDRPTFTTIPIQTEVYSCPVWGCTQIFQKYKDIEIHCQLIHPNRLQATNRLDRRGVDIVGYDEVSDNSLLHRCAASSTPLLMVGLPKSWAETSEFSVNYLQQKHPKAKTMWNYVDDSGRNYQWIGSFSKFTDSTNRSMRNSCCVKMEYEVPTSWEQLPYFNTNYLNHVKESQYNKSFLFIGGSGSIISLHRQFLDYSITNLQGMIRVILFPPNKIIEMGEYNKHLLNKDNNKTRYIYFEPQLSQDDLDLISKFSGRVVFLNKEETLIIPAGWYFQSTILEDECISLHYQHINQFNIEFFLQNACNKQRNIFGELLSPLDFVKVVVADFLKRADHAINGGHRKANRVQPNTNPNPLVEQASKQWNNYQGTTKEQTQYHNATALLKECFTLISVYYLATENKRPEAKGKVEQLIESLKKTSNDLNYSLILMSSFYASCKKSLVMMALPPTIYYFSFIFIIK